MTQWNIDTGNIGTGNIDTGNIDTGNIDTVEHRHSAVEYRHKEHIQREYRHSGI